MMSMIRGLEVWRDLDRADAIKLSRHEVIELLQEIEALRRCWRLSDEAEKLLAAATKPSVRPVLRIGSK